MYTFSFKRRYVFAAAGLLATVLPQWVAAQAYPVKPIQLVVPLAAGGPADIIARALALKLADALKQPMIVVNQPGAGGSLGGKAVALAQPDGYTLLFALDTMLTANPILYGSKTGFSPEKDLQPITTLGTVGVTLAVHPSLKVTNFAQFVELARKQNLNYGSAGNATPGHLSMELLADLIKADMTHVPYKGAAPALTDLVGGQINAGFLVTQGVVPYAASGKLIPLAISSSKRSPLLPLVPTVSELGFPDATIEFSMVLLAPAKTPAAIVQRLHQETGKALASEDMQKLMKNGDYAVIADTPEQAKARLARTTISMSKLIIARDIKAE